MNTDFLCERRLSKLNPYYHKLVQNAVFVLCNVLEKYKNYFPDFTDHTILHSMQVLEFCNRLLGEQALLLNEDELYILIMSAYLHDSGMGVSEADYKALFIRKYADLFEIPSKEHIKAIAIISEAHRNMDLYDSEIIPIRINQTSVKINRLDVDKKHITVLDTDLGTDDACALLVLNSLDYKPDYIVASHGNTTLDDACKNAVILKKYLSLKSKVVKGLPAPDNENVSLSEKNTFHGKDGLANCSEGLKKRLKITEEELSDIMPFEDFLNELLQYDFITYITIGTLTNLAFLLGNESFCKKLNGAYVMGGGLEEFNCSHDTEFNFSKDPESVKKIITSGLNITLFPLDVTNHQTLNDGQIDKLEEIGTYPEFIEFLRYNAKANGGCNGISAAVLHDVLPVLFLSHPECFKLEDKRIVSDKYGHIEESSSGEAMHVCVDMEKGRLEKVMKKAFEN